MLDLDMFKKINDTYGHQAGDEVLRVTATRLLKAVRREDTVARLGGDEFVVLLPELTNLQAVERIAATIVETLAVPIVSAEHEMPISVSAGICVAAAGELDAESMLKKADAALYHAKARGRNRFELSKPDAAPTQAV